MVDKHWTGPYRGPCPLLSTPTRSGWKRLSCSPELSAPSRAYWDSSQTQSLNSLIIRLLTSILMAWFRADRSVGLSCPLKLSEAVPLLIGFSAPYLVSRCKVQRWPQP